MNDPWRKVIGETFAYDDATDKVHHTRTEDVEPVMDDLRLEQAMNPGGWNASRTWKKVGSIPLIVMDQWFAEGFNALAPGNEKEVVKRLQAMPKLTLKHY
jgi:hypothetical protein